MDLAAHVVEAWDASQEWQGMFKRADYIALAPWRTQAGDWPNEFTRFVDEMAQELSTLRMDPTSFRVLTESYLETVRKLDPILVAAACPIIEQYLHLPVTARRSFLEDRTGFLQGLRDVLERAGLHSDWVTALMDAAPDLMDDVAETVRSNFTYIPDDPQRGDQDQFTKMTGHIGELIGYLVFRDLRKATILRTKVVVDDPNGDRPGLDVLAFVFDPDDPARDQALIVEGKGTRRTVGHMRDQIVTKLRSVDARPVYYEFERLKAELVDSRDTPHPSGLSLDLIERRLTDAWWRLKKRHQIEQVKLCGFVAYNDEHHPPTRAQLKDFANIADDKRRIEVLLFPLPWFDDAVREIFRRAWTI